MTNPPPTPNQSKPIWELVIDDMQARDHVGRQRYGTPLQANNGRDALQDAYEEALDLAVYLRQAIEERKEGKIKESDLYGLDLAEMMHRNMPCNKPNERKNMMLYLRHLFLRCYAWMAGMSHLVAPWEVVEELRGNILVTTYQLLPKGAVCHCDKCKIERGEKINGVENAGLSASDRN